MPQHTETRHFPYSPEQLFTLVADVEKYPRISLPWCKAIRILRRNDAENWMDVEMKVSFKGLSEKYSSRVHLTPPNSAHEKGEIHVKLLSGPFSHLTNDWRFEPSNQNASETDIHFNIEFRFASRMLEKLIGGLFERAAQKMVSAFSTRADALYGEQASSE